MNKEKLNRLVGIHCGACGLYLRFSEEHLGGRGRCPRCGSKLKLSGMAGGLKHESSSDARWYVYASEDNEVMSKDTRPVRSTDGPSVLYRCIGCENEYESLLFEQKYYNLCPICNSPGLPIEEADS